MITALSVNTGGLGRFGNNCFTIAGVIGIATKSGQPYGFPQWITKDNATFGQEQDNIGDHLATPLPGIPDVQFSPYGYFWGYRDIQLASGNWTIDAHMQSEKYFKHCMPLIRETFRFKDEPPQNDFVAIHYRAGDYTEGENGHHPRCSKEYYEEAMKLFPDSKFILFSDDVQGWYELMIGDNPATLIHFLLGSNSERVKHSSKNYLEDFKLMKRCKHFITANSSFSLFAAILGEHPDKKIVCPARWFGSSMPSEFGTEDIYPENAIII